MASPAQIAANRANAQHSTGPRSHQGKAKSAANRMTHGLSSRQFVILPGQELEFESFMDDLRLSIQPHGALESDLFTQLAHAAWTLRRCRLAEADLAASLDPHFDPLLAPELYSHLRTLDLYARRAERAYHRSLRELKALQTNRQQAFETAREAFGPRVAGHPAPLTDNALLDPFRRRNAKAAARRDHALIEKQLSEAAGFSGPLPAFELPEHSNPIPAPKATSAAR